MSDKENSDIDSDRGTDIKYVESLCLILFPYKGKKVDWCFRDRV
jgi:hypothetical protein